jgi:hypothetical protein
MKLTKHTINGIIERSQAIEDRQDTSLLAREGKQPIRIQYTHYGQLQSEDSNESLGEGNEDK